MGHDQLFKRFFHEFLQDFLELFYPDVAARLDFTTLEFLDKYMMNAAGSGVRRIMNSDARSMRHAHRTVQRVAFASERDGNYY